MIVLLAQGELFGGAGWAGAGLLGLVLGWLLMIYLPRQEARMDLKEKSYLESLEAKNITMVTRLSEQQTAFQATLTTLEEKHLQAITKISDHCKEELDIIANKFLVEMRAIVKQSS